MQVKAGMGRHNGGVNPGNCLRKGIGQSREGW